MAAGFTKILFMEGFGASNGLRKSSEIQEFRRLADVTIQSMDEIVSLLGVVKID